MKPRAAAVVLRGDAILLVRRVKAGREYYTLPGGAVEDNETPEQACVRELLEETNLTGEVDAPLWVLENQGRTERYFLIGPVEGMARMGDGPGRSTPGNTYELVWMDVDKLSDIDLLPTLVRDHLAAAV